MSSDKKDLTRIEDLGEYLHELEEEAQEIPPTPDDIPSEETSDFSLESTEEVSSDETSLETPAFDSPDESQSESFPEEFPATENENVAFEESDTFKPENDFESEAKTATPIQEEHITEPFQLSDDALVENEVTTSETKNDFQLEDQPKEEIFVEEIKETPAPIVEDTAKFKAPENFQDIKTFSENTTLTGVGAEGNPSFSLLIKSIKYIEDVNDILRLLKELELIADSEEQTKERLTRGSLLIPRISEYAAIFVAHKLRRFDIDIQVGLSDEIHPPKHLESPEVGLASKFNLYQNQTHHFQFDDPKLELSQIMVSATQGLEGYQVIRYLGVASEHKMIDSYIIEDENSEEIPHHYQELAQKLKAHALRANSNAVVGVNYQLTPIPTEIGITGHRYRLSCTGNLVWVNKL